MTWEAEMAHWLEYSKQLSSSFSPSCTWNGSSNGLIVRSNWNEKWVDQIESIICESKDSIFRIYQLSIMVTHTAMEVVNSEKIYIL